MYEISRQLGQIGRMKAKKTSIDDKRRKRTDEEIKTERAISAYKAIDKPYFDYKRQELIKRLESDPKSNTKPHTKPLGQSQNRQRTRS